MNRKVTIASAVLLVIIVAGIGYYEVSSYESVVVQTTVVTGKITTDQASGGAAGPSLPGLAGGAKKTSTTSGLSFITISIPSGSFTQILGCGTNAYYSGETIQVADQLLRSGGHSYAPDVACKGATSPFQSLHLHITSSSSTVT